MRFILDFVFICVIAAALGLGLTYAAMRHPPAVDAIRSGPWLATPGEGTPDIDAYTLAARAARGEVPLAAADGLAFRAVTDSEDRPLLSSCTYSVSGDIPAVRAWSLAAYDPEGAVFPNAAGRYAFSSGEVMRNAAGAIDIRVGSVAQPGDWLPTSGRSELTLMLRLYETTIGAISAGRSAPDLPGIRRIGCAS